MQYRQLGHSGMDVSALSLGSWLTYEYMDEQDALAVMSYGLAAGINFLDDARYNDRSGRAPMKTGYSEVVFGQLLRKSGWNRSDLIIANKLWYEFYPEQSPEGELDGSLKRLQLEYLDLVYCAPLPATLLMGELVQQIDDLIQTGKLRAWGVLNWPPDQIAEATQVATNAGLHAPCAAQLRYSLLQTSPVEDQQTQNLCRSSAIGVVASYSLYGGLLSGKYQHTAALTGRFGAKDVEDMRQKGLLKQVDQVISVAQEVGCTPAQLALAYCLQNNQVSSLLFGATKVAQVEENLRALDLLPHMTDEMIARLHSL